MSATGRVALFRGPRQPFDMAEMPVPEPRPGAVLVRVRIANICGSDLHAWRGDFRLAGLGGKLPHGARPRDDGHNRRARPGRGSRQQRRAASRGRPRRLRLFHRLRSLPFLPARDAAPPATTSTWR